MLAFIDKFERGLISIIYKVIYRVLRRNKEEFWKNFTFDMTSVKIHCYIDSPILTYETIFRKKIFAVFYWYFNERYYEGMLAVLIILVHSRAKLGCGIMCLLLCLCPHMGLFTNQVHFLLRFKSQFPAQHPICVL